MLIIFAHRPVCQIPREQGIEELYLIPRKEIRYRKFPPFNKDQKWFTPHNFFVALDVMLKLYDRMPLSMVARESVALRLDLDAGTHQGQRWAGGDLSGHGQFDHGAAMSRLSGRRSHWCRRRSTKSNRWKSTTRCRSAISASRRCIFQPCHSPIWDTALLVNAFIETGMPQDHPSLQKAGAYLLSRQTNNGWRLEVLVSRCGTGRLVFPV